MICRHGFHGGECLTEVCENHRSRHPVPPVDLLPRERARHQAARSAYEAAVEALARGDITEDQLADRRAELVQAEAKLRVAERETRKASVRR